MKRAFLAAGLLAFGTVQAETSQAGGSAVGNWVMENGKVTIRIAPCGEALCGTIVAMKKPLDGNGRPKRDKHNPDPDKRDRPVIGLTVLSAMRPDGDGGWAGRIYNADDGNTYVSTMELDGNVMRVKGCVVFFCKNLRFVRIN
ncbi:MAG: DUF2147 domain-containing protein [Rhizobiales bacterium]|nr:DUF2147 domain-containing protein [Hyphomicrobiales bacterium]MBI3672181.1 DUF2147 domain-containing protein [Hyphomicrobiales bacterium]